MKYKTSHQGWDVEVSPASESDWRGKNGHEVTLSKPGYQPVTSWNNYDNATKALSFAKEEIDSNSVPEEPAPGIFNAIARLFG